MRRDTRSSLLLFAAAVAIKAAVLFALHDHPLLQPRGELDTAVFVDFAKNGAPPQAYFVSPLYLYFLRVIFLAGGDLLAARIVQILLGAIAVVLLAAIARELFGEKAGWVAGGLAALSGVVTFHEVVLLQSALDPFLVACTFWLLLVRRNPLLAGLAAGLLTLNRPNVLLWLPIAALLLLPRRKVLALFTAGVLLAIVPVTLRNWLVARELVLISSHGGLNFYIGNNAAADGAYEAVEGIRPDIRGQQVDTQRVAEEAEGRKLTSREVSRHFYDRAFAWMREEPLAWLRLFGRKLVMTFSQRDIPLNHNYDFYALDPPLRFLLAGPWIVFPLAAVVLLRAPRPLVAFLAIYALSIAVFFVSTRYRVPLLVAAVPLAGGGLAALIDGPRRMRKLAVAAVVAIPVLWNASADSGIANERAALLLVEIESGGAADAGAQARLIAAQHEDPAELYLRAGRALRHTKRHAEATRMFESALDSTSLEPQTLADAATELVEEYMRARRGEDALRVARTLDAGRFDAEQSVRLCRAAMDLRDGETALRFCQRAAALRPDSAAVHHNLGTAFVMTGNRAAAMQSLETARRLDPRNPSTLVNLAVLQAQNGDFANAHRNAEEALRLRPGYPQAVDLLRRLPTPR